MASSTSFTGVLILQALAQRYRLGFDIMQVTGLPSGTIYPALRRLESLDFVTFDWEKDLAARPSMDRKSLRHQPLSISRDEARPAFAAQIGNF